MKTQQQCNTDSHVAITGKITINLQCIPINPHQVFYARIQSGIIKNTLYEIDTDVI